MFQRLLDHAHKLKSASQCLEDAFESYAPTPDLNCECRFNTTFMMWMIVAFEVFVMITRNFSVADFFS